MRLASRSAQLRLLKWLIFGLLSGGIGGAAGVVFTVTLDLFIDLFWGLVVYLTEEGLVALVPAIPLMGGMAVGALNYLLDRDAFHVPCATDGMIELVHVHHGFTRPSKGALKILTASLTIGTGGSAGRECPMAYSGSALASAVNSLIARSRLARALKFTRRDAKIVAICGASGAIGGVFGAPLGGGVFASEVLYSEDVEVEALPPAILASTIGFAIFSLTLGLEPLVVFPRFNDMLIFSGDLAYNVFHASSMALLGVVSALAALLWVKVFYSFYKRMKSSRLPRPIRPAIGGLLDGIVVVVGLLLLGEYYLWGMGYWVIQEAIEFTELFEELGYLLIFVFMALFLGKVLAALAYSWTFTLAAELTSLITINVVKEAPGLFVYPPPMLFLGLVGSALTAIFAVGMGLFISLKAKSARAAQQMISVGFFAIFFFGPMIIARLITRPAGLKLTWGLVAPAAAVLVLLDALLLALAVKRFQRARLILD